MTCNIVVVSKQLTNCIVIWNMPRAWVHWLVTFVLCGFKLLILKQPDCWARERSITLLFIHETLSEERRKFDVSLKKFIMIYIPVLFSTTGRRDVIAWWYHDQFFTSFHRSSLQYMVFRIHISVNRAFSWGPTHPIAAYRVRQQSSAALVP